MSSGGREHRQAFVERPDCTLDDAAVVVLPAPLEATVSYGGGTGRGPAAILEASLQVELYDEQLGFEPYRAGIWTEPPLAFPTGSNERAEVPLPHDAEAVLDPKRFEVTDATGPAKANGVGAKLRDAAIQGDRARGPMRNDNPDKALEIWKALVQGRWSMVDWFDTDGRRFVLAVPNAPDTADPRGLTEREMQVVTYVIFGHSNKFIAYQLGISRARVSMLLSSSMRKLGARTPAQLVKKIRDLRCLHVNGAHK